MSAEKVGTTPGPWRVDEHNHCVIESARHGNIAIVNLARMSAADAHLIASAPDLLAALKDLLDEQEDAPLERRRTEWAEACARARRAIAQAEGGA